jgi:hypothetical protein
MDWRAYKGRAACGKNEGEVATLDKQEGLARSPDLPRDSVGFDLSLRVYYNTSLDKDSHYHHSSAQLIER